MSGGATLDDPPAADPSVPPGSTARGTPERPCQNCGDPTPGNYCRSCGQRKVEVRVSLRRMLLEALDDQFSLNSALPRTLGALFFRPGHLTREYMNGRIARYIPPFRLYLVSSLLFFLVLSLSLRRQPAGGAAAATPDTARTAAEGDSAGPRRSWIGSPRVNTGSPALDSLLQARLRSLGELEPEVAVRRVGDQFLEYVPQTVFVLLPVFAGILKLLYLRRGRLYVEHFVFALHLHAFVFLCFLVLYLVRVEGVHALVSLWMMAYTCFAMYHVYGQGWLRTGLKYVVLGFSYVLVLSLAMAATLLLSVALM